MVAELYIKLYIKLVGVTWHYATHIMLINEYWLLLILSHVSVFAPTIHFMAALLSSELPINL